MSSERQDRRREVLEARAAFLMNAVNNATFLETPLPPGIGEHDLRLGLDAFPFTVGVTEEEKRKRDSYKMDGLTTGRMVHYVMPENGGDNLDGTPTPARHRAAVVTDVIDKEQGIVSLNVNLVSTDRERVIAALVVMPYEDVTFDGKVEPAPGTWHWIERS